ncbi:MAG: hypothetical protein KY462_14175 [Actinobacteria bacterium]|nr:hypothetical protein [Actinomycetota bacterium]
MPDDRQGGSCQLVGWLLFLAGVVLFLMAGIRDGDLLTTVGSVLFLAGVIAFLVPSLSDRDE